MQNRNGIHLHLLTHMKKQMIKQYSVTIHITASHPDFGHNNLFLSDTAKHNGLTFILTPSASLNRLFYLFFFSASLNRL